ncbi:MAG: hypothetical protein GVY26_06910 [Bacteroidetes bacterium]|nr:hypothetical protein [Bacteroidota bacterium]
MLLAFVAVFSSFQLPDNDFDPDNYVNECLASEPFDNTGTATAYYNDPDNDCISTDWVVIFVDSEGNVSYYWPDDYDPLDNSYDFNGPFWGCCMYSNSGDGGSTGASGGGSTNGGEDADDIACECSYNFNPNTAILTIDCPCL